MPSTKTGWVLEAMIVPSLINSGYHFEKQKQIGFRPNGSKHIIDAVVSDNGKKILVSAKWQQVSGTAEQKVPFEIICLLDAIKKDPDISKAYLVLGGCGWTLKEYYLSNNLNSYIQYMPYIKVLTLEQFVSLVNCKQI